MTHDTIISRFQWNRKLMRGGLGRKEGRVDYTTDKDTIWSLFPFSSVVLCSIHCFLSLEFSQQVLSVQAAQTFSSEIMSWYIVKKILLVLIFPGVTRSKPQRQNCFLGQCNQNNIGGGRGFGGGGLGLFGNRGNFQRFPSFNPSLNIQNCGGSQCNQNNVGGAAATGAGGSFFGGPGVGGGVGGVGGIGGSGFPSFNPSLNIQNCRGSQCGQNNFRKKRDTVEYKSSQKTIRLSPEDFSEGFPTRKKREVSSPAVSEGESPPPHMPPQMTVPVPVTLVKNYVCAGRLVSSTCINSHCRIICSDGVKVSNIII